MEGGGKWHNVTACGVGQVTDGLFPFIEDADRLCGPWQNGKYYSYRHISPTHSDSYQLEKDG